MTTRSFTINAMQFTVSNNGTQWILDVGPDSVVLSVKGLEDIEFSWEDSAVDMDSVYQPGIDTPFSPSIFDEFQ